MIDMNVFNKVAMAANKPVPNSKKYTIEDFEAFMPQFFKKETKTTGAGKEYEESVCLIPEAYMDDLLIRVNANILECRWYEKWKYASSLYVAHFATLYLRSYSSGSNSADEAAGSGAVIGNVSSSSLGDASVSYDNSTVNQALSAWGAWATTKYGIELINEAKLLGIGGAYFI